MRKKKECSKNKKKCVVCDQCKDKSEFHRSRITVDGLFGECKSCSVVGEQTIRILKQTNRLQEVKSCLKTIKTKLKTS